MEARDIDSDLLEELAALDALDLLDEAQRLRFQRLLDDVDEPTRKRLAQFRDVAASVGISPAPVNPPPHVKKRLLREIERNIRPVRASEGWVEHTIPGIRYKTLTASPDRATVLARMESGVQFPQHQHSADEECYVVDGTLVAGEMELSKGDYLFAGAGTAHGPFTTSEGCTLLLVLAGDDYRAFTA